MKSRTLLAWLVKAAGRTRRVDEPRERARLYRRRSRRAAARACPAGVGALSSTNSRWDFTIWNGCAILRLVLIGAYQLLDKRMLMDDGRLKKARNPKVIRFTISLDDNINARLEHIADKLGQNKASTAATLMAVGINVFEPLLSIGVQQYVEQAVEDKSKQLVEDVQRLS